jgi:hypothetical protein
LPCFKLTNFLTHILKVLFPRCIFLKSHFFNICWKYHVACRWRMLSFYKFFFILVSRINKFSSLVECLCGEHVIESIWYSLLRRLPHHLWFLNYIIIRVDMICNAGLTHWQSFLITKFHWWSISLNRGYKIFQRQWCCRTLLLDCSWCICRVCHG